MERSTNALAELAERLDGISEVFRHEETTRYEDVQKAQRIVAELAKVNTIGDVLKIMAKCNEIAEEGAGDGK